MTSTMNTFLIIVALSVTVASAQTKFDKTGPSDLTPVEPRVVNDPPVQPAVPAERGQQQPSNRFDFLDSARIHVEGFQSIEPKRVKRRAFVFSAAESDDEDLSSFTDDVTASEKSESEADAESTTDEGSGDVLFNSLGDPGNDEGPNESSFTEEDNNILPIDVDGDDGDSTGPTTTPPSPTSSIPEPRIEEDREEEEDWSWSDLNLVREDARETTSVPEDIEATNASTDESQLEESTDSAPVEEDGKINGTEDNETITSQVSSEGSPWGVWTDVEEELQSTIDDGTDGLAQHSTTRSPANDESTTESWGSWDFSNLNLAKVGAQEVTHGRVTGEPSTGEDNGKNGSTDQEVVVTLPPASSAPSTTRHPTVSPSPSRTGHSVFGELRMKFQENIGLILGIILGIPAAVVLCYFIYVKFLRRHSGSLNVSTSSLTSQKRLPSAGTSFAADSCRRTLVSEVNELQVSPNGKGPRPPPLPDRKTIPN